MTNIVSDRISDQNFTIRQETGEDYQEVDALIKAAFLDAEHSDGNEQDLVIALRKSRFYISELSLVAEIDGRIAGYVLFTKAMVGDAVVLALAPLAVHPDFQMQGIGSALVLEGHRIAQELGYSYVIVLGSDTYYPQFGYQKAAELGIELPEGFPEEFFMAVRLVEIAPPIHGAVTYAPEFGL